MLFGFSGLTEIQGPSKRRKVTATKSKNSFEGAKKKPKAKGKDKAADRGIIPIPAVIEEDVELSDEDLDLLEEYGNAASFLNRLDEKGIAR